MPTTLIIRTAGTNCDRELVYAFERAGSDTESIHLNKLIDEPALIERFDLVGVPGGFSYGDDIAAGRIFANRLRHRLLEPFQQAVARGVPIIAPCNGFQVLVKMGLLPDPATAKQTVTLADNTSGRFVDKWITLRAEADSPCIWTQGLNTFDLPIAHGEGRFTAPPDVIDALEANKQIALRYSTPNASDQAPTSTAQPPHNPNGSVNDIAGICDPTGLVLGLMPHPERFVDPTNHPQWSRRGEDWLTQTTPGLQMFINAVQHVTNTAATPA